MGPVNSKDDFYSSVMRQSEFEHWKQLGNDLAVEALQNSDTLSWWELERKLRKALFYYNKTPSFQLLYNNDVNQNQQIDNQRRRNEIIKMMQQQSYYGFSYPDEIMKVSKNKAMCLRALIQNLYLQMQMNLEKQSGIFKNDLEMITELIMQYMDNANLCLMYINDKLASEEKQRKTMSRGRQMVNQDSPYVERIDNHFSAPGSGGSPNTKSVSLKSSITPSEGGGGGSHLAYSMPPARTEKISFSQQQINEQDGTQQFTYTSSTTDMRYIELIESFSFLVQDKFLKNLIAPEPSLTKKIQFYSSLMVNLHRDHLEFQRQLCWILSKLYYKKSVHSQNTQNLDHSLGEIRNSIFYFEQYINNTNIIKQNRILVQHQFLERDTFLSKSSFETHQVRIRNHENILHYQYNNSKTSVTGNSSDQSLMMLKSPIKYKLFNNMKQMANNIDDGRSVASSQSRSLFGSNNPNNRSNISGLYAQKAATPDPNSPMRKLTTQNSQYVNAPIATRTLSFYNRMNDKSNSKKHLATISIQNVRAVQDSPDSLHTQSMSIDEKSIPGPFSNHGPMSDNMQIVRHLSSSIASIRDITENSENFKNSIKEMKDNHEELEFAGTPDKEMMSKDAIQNLTDVQIVSPLNHQVNDVEAEHANSRNNNLKMEQESTETVQTNHLKIREEVPQEAITKLSPSNPNASNEPQDSIEGSSPSKNKSLNLQIDINCIQSSEGNQSSNINPRKRKNKKNNQDELDKKLEKVMRHTPNSYQQKMIQDRLINKILQQKQMQNQSRNGGSQRSISNMSHQSCVTPRISTCGNDGDGKKSHVVRKNSQNLKTVRSFQSLMTTGIGGKTNQNRSQNENEKKENNNNRSQQEGDAMSPLQRFNYTQRMKKNNMPSPKFNSGVNFNQDLPNTSSGNNQQMNDQSRTRSISTSSPKAQAQKIPRNKKSGFMMVPISKEQKKAMDTKEKAKQQLKIQKMKEKEEHIDQLLKKNQPKEESVNIILKSNFKGCNYHNRGIKSLGRGQISNENQQTELQRISKRNLTPNFIDPATKLEGNMDTEESKAKHPGQPFLRKKPEIKTSQPVKTAVRKQQIKNKLPLDQISSDKALFVSQKGALGVASKNFQGNQQQPEAKSAERERERKPAVPILSQQKKAAEKKMTTKPTNNNIGQEIVIQEVEPYKPPVEQYKVSEKDFLPLQKLGRGSFGDVYLIKDLFPGSGKLYAMKTLNKKSRLEESWLRYIKTERDVLAHSNNPFIVKLQYAFQTARKLFLVIDFCPGGDLETMISEEKAPFSEDKAKLFTAEILIALKDLHARNIIYRDLKPDNVVIDNDGHTKLIDFGMAKTNITEVQKGAKTFCGSVKYLAPEMLRKIGHGQALDWYLLGVLLYEMLVGVTPYFSTNKDELFDNIINGKLKLPRNISIEAKSLIIGLLNRNPTRRLGAQSGDEGAEEIMRHQFFSNIDWVALFNKQKTGNFVPKIPKYTTKDFEEEFQETQLTKAQIEEIYYGKNEGVGKQEKIIEKFKNSWVDGWEFVRPSAAPNNLNHPMQDQMDQSEDASERTMPKSASKSGPQFKQGTAASSPDHNHDPLDNQLIRTPDNQTPRKQNPIASPTSMNKKTPAFEMELNNFEMFQNRHGAKYSEMN